MKLRSLTAPQLIPSIDKHISLSLASNLSPFLTPYLYVTETDSILFVCVLKCHKAQQSPNMFYNKVTSKIRAAVKWMLTVRAAKYAKCIIWYTKKERKTRNITKININFVVKHVFTCSTHTHSTISSQRSMLYKWKSKNNTGEKEEKLITFFSLFMFFVLNCNVFASGKWINSYVTPEII